MQYAFFAITLLIMLFFALSQTSKFEDGEKINHVIAFAEFFLVCCLASIIAYDIERISFLNWCYYCTVSMFLVRGGFYDFILNLVRGKGIGYVSPKADGDYTSNEESWYDDLLSKLKLKPNFVRVTFAALSISWLLLFNKIF
jgi:hypothetical protein